MLNRILLRYIMLVGTIGRRIRELNVVGSRRRRGRLGGREVVLRVRIVGGVTVIERSATGHVGVAVRGWHVWLVGTPRVSGLGGSIKLLVIIVLRLLLVLSGIVGRMGGHARSLILVLIAAQGGMLRACPIWHRGGRL